MHNIRSLFLLLFSISIFAQDEPVYDEKDFETFQRFYEKQLKSNKGNENILVLPGVIANRQAKTITIDALATGLDENAPMEYYLVSTIGKEYEALTTSHLKASDLEAAFTFLGISKGDLTDYANLRFWPYGQNISITLAQKSDGKFEPLTSYAYNGQTQTSPVNKWFIYTGSTLTKTQKVNYNAANDTGDLISTYNSDTTMIDVPLQRPKSATYGNISPNIENQLKRKEHVLIRIQLPRIKSTLHKYKLYIQLSDIKTNIHQASYKIIDQDGREKKIDQFHLLLESLYKKLERKELIYMNIVYPAKGSRLALTEISKILVKLADEEYIKMNGLADQLYPKAFLTIPEWTMPTERIIQPVEIVIPPKGEVMRFRYFNEKYDDEGEKILTEETYNFKSLAELNKIMLKRKLWETDTVLFYTDQSIPYEVYQMLYNGIRKRFNNTYVFDIKEFKELNK